MYFAKFPPDLYQYKYARALRLVKNRILKPIDSPLDSKIKKMKQQIIPNNAKKS